MRHLLGKAILLILVFFIVLQTAPGVIAQESPYRLTWGGCAAGIIGISSEMISLLPRKNNALLTSEDLLAFDKMNINHFDRNAVNQWDPQADIISEISRGMLIVSPAVILAGNVINKDLQSALTYSVMYLEVAALTIGLTDLTKILSNRKRPFLYNPSLSLEEKENLINSENIYDSFFSGHTSSAFASAVFFSKTVSDLFENKKLSIIVWSSSMALATATGYLRYHSGQHFPTDIIAGAIVGSAIGYLIPSLHKHSKKAQRFTYTFAGNSMTIRYWL